MYSADDLDPPRIFDAHQQIRGNPSKLISRSSGILITRYATSREEFLVVSIDGACRNNGQPGATASYGVHFAPNSSINSNGRVPDSEIGTDTNQKAELHALSKALDIVEEKFGNDMLTSRLVVVTDSSYLVRDLSRNMWEWEYQEYKNAKEKPMVNGEVFKALHKRIGKLEINGKDVCFWDVEREWNTEADWLANTAIDNAAS